MIDTDCDEAIYKMYNLDMDRFRLVAIDFDKLKAATERGLKNIGIFRIDQMISLSYKQLIKFRGLGRMSMYDIHNYVISLNKEYMKSNIDDKESIPENILDKRDLIFKGNFTEELYDQLTTTEGFIVKRYEEGYTLLDKELIESCIENPTPAFYISKMLSRYVKKIENMHKLSKARERLHHKLDNYAKPYFDIYSLRYRTSNDFVEYIKNKEVVMDDLLSASIAGELSVIEVVNFINWSSYDLKSEIDSFLKEIYARGSLRNIVIELRIKKKSLREVGGKFCISTERVRQIESKIMKSFGKWQKDNKFLPRLFADFNGEKIIKLIDLQEYFGDTTDALLYLLQSSSIKNFSYDKKTDTIIIADNEIINSVREYVKNMPSEIGDSLIMYEYKKRALEEYNIPEEVFEREVLIQYKLTGTLYHKNRLTREKMFRIVLKKYYPDGMNVYDGTELCNFRNFFANEFGEVPLPENNKAISACIIRCCILCGCGKYRVKDGSKIPHELTAEIYQYIMNSNKNLFYFTEIFVVFKDELIKQGIDNSFFLHGILKEDYGDKLFFRKDYVCKDKEKL